MFKYKIADVVFTTEHKYGYVQKVCADYICEDEDAEVNLVVSDEDILYERSRGGEGQTDAYLESLVLCRKLCDYVLDKKDGFFMHASAIMVDGKAYLFTAKSGTGKSTHTRLWRELLGERAVMINDDKPIIRLIDGKFYAYGTPWNGKHRLSTDTKAPIKAICILNRGENNRIERIAPKDALIKILDQTLRPIKEERLDKSLELIGKLLKSVNLYKLWCNVSLDAAKLSYEFMKKGE